MTEPFVAFNASTDAMQGSRVLHAEHSGVLRLHDNDLVIEFTTRRSVFGGGSAIIVIGSDGARVNAPPPETNDSEVHTVRVSLEHIGDVELRGGFLRQPRLDIEVNRMSALAALPWANGSRVSMRLARRDSRRARELAIDMQMRLADNQLRRLDESTRHDT